MKQERQHRREEMNEEEKARYEATKNIESDGRTQVAVAVCSESLIDV